MTHPVRPDATQKRRTLFAALAGAAVLTVVGMVTVSYVTTKSSGFLARTSRLEDKLGASEQLETSDRDPHSECELCRRELSKPISFQEPDDGRASADHPAVSSEDIARLEAAIAESEKNRPTTPVGFTSDSEWIGYWLEHNPERRDRVAAPRAAAGHAARIEDLPEGVR